MIFSSKAEYGVRLMVELGRQSPEHPHSLKAIADAEGLPLAYLEQVVARLRKAGLVMSARGAHGGYWLARPAEDIAMHEVVQALEGAIAPMECFVHDHTERVLCSHEPDSGRGCAQAPVDACSGRDHPLASHDHAGGPGRVLASARSRARHRGRCRAPTSDRRHRARAGP